MAMPRIRSAHRALVIEEILRAVLEHVPSQLREDQATLEHVPPMDTEASRTLASLARVCKALSERALDMLWKDLYDLEHLLRLLPSFQLVSEGQGEQHYCLTGVVSEPEWARLMIYARRVKRFEHYRRNFSVTVFESLAQLCEGRPLFPSLQELRWRVGTQQALHAADISLFIAPRLRLLSIRSHLNNMVEAYPLDDRPQSSGFLLAVTTMLANQAVGLQVLDVVRIGMDRLVLGTLGQLPKLNTLRCSIHPKRSNNDDVAPSLAAPVSNHSLRSLEVFVSDLDRLSLISQPLEFNSLKILTIRSLGGGQWVTNFMSAVSAPHLRSLTLRSPVPWDSDPDCSNHLQAIMKVTASKFAGSLRELCLVHSVATCSPRYTMEALLPLLQLTQLTSVAIHVRFRRTHAGSIQVLTDEDIESVAKAWPQLLNLSINLDGLNLSELPHCVLPSPSCLETLAQLCLNLRSIHLPIAFVRSHPSTLVMEKISSYVTTSHPLELMSLYLLGYEEEDEMQGDREAVFVRVANWRGSEIESLARMIHQLFPSLNLAMCLSPLRLGRHTTWDRVVETIPLLEDLGGVPAKESTPRLPVRHASRSNPLRIQRDRLSYTPPVKYDNGNHDE